MHEATFQEWALAGAGLDELQTDQDINYMREAFLVDEACFPYNAAHNHNIMISPRPRPRIGTLCGVLPCTLCHDHASMAT